MIFSPQHVPIGNRKAKEFMSPDPEMMKTYFILYLPSRKN